MATEYSVLEKYIECECYDPFTSLQIGTGYHNRKVQDLLDQLLEIFRFVEQSLVIKFYADCSLSSQDEIQHLFDEAASTVEAAVKKLTGKQSPDDPPLLRTQSESVHDQDIESVIGEMVWNYLKLTAEGYCLKTVGDLIEYIKVLASTDKPFYSKWSNDAPIEFFNYPKRFSYADQEARFEHWDDVLKDDVPLITNDAAIRTWGDLKAALRGKDKIMDESEFSQGTFSRPLRDGIRLVPSLK